jgi:phosphoribosylaminoimidazole-succinocarboxamide synthase
MGNMMLIFQEKHSVKGIVSEEDYLVLEKYTETYFKEELKLRQQLILVDTKYEFGKTKRRSYSFN